jgi:hypothetical protein
MLLSIRPGISTPTITTWRRVLSRGAINLSQFGEVAVVGAVVVVGAGVGVCAGGVETAVVGVGVGVGVGVVAGVGVEVGVVEVAGVGVGVGVEVGVVEVAGVGEAEVVGCAVEGLVEFEGEGNVDQVTTTASALFVPSKGETPPTTRTSTSIMLALIPCFSRNPATFSARRNARAAEVPGPLA